jgi:hypothetical protein
MRSQGYRRASGPRQVNVPVQAHVTGQLWSVGGVVAQQVTALIVASVPRIHVRLTIALR